MTKGRKKKGIKFILLANYINLHIYSDHSIDCLIQYLLYLGTWLSKYGHSTELPNMIASQPHVSYNYAGSLVLIMQKRLRKKAP